MRAPPASRSPSAADTRPSLPRETTRASEAVRWRCREADGVKSSSRTPAACQGMLYKYTGMPVNGKATRGRFAACLRGGSNALTYSAPCSSVLYEKLEVGESSDAQHEGGRVVRSAV